MKKSKLLVSTAVLCTSLLISTSVFAKSHINIHRLSGQDRYGTSNAIVSQGWKQSNYAVLVNSQNFPDAIVSSPLAKKYNAPILLTDSNTLTDSTKQKLQNLGVKNVFIIGGTGVVSSDIENTLESMGISTKRIYGNDRYETSVNVAKELGTSNGVFVVSGEHYEDALSVAPIADKLQYPIILTSSNQVSDTVRNYINDQVKVNNGEVDVIGGTDTLNSSIVSQLSPTKTYNQSDKYQRNLALINNYKDKLDLSNVYVASDKGFADALSGSALAGMNGNPIILLGNSNQVNVNNFITNNNITNVNILGGTGVISTSDVNNIVNNSDTSVTTPSAITIPSSTTTTITPTITTTVGKIEITSTTLTIANNGQTGIVNYKVLDRNGNDITSSALANNLIFQSGIGNATGSNGVITITSPYVNLTALKTVTITITDSNSGLWANRTLSIVSQNSDNTTSSNNSQSDYIISDGSNIINLDDYSDYISADYKDRIKTFVNSMNPSRILLQNKGDSIIIFLFKDNTAKILLDTPTIGLSFYKNGSTGLALANLTGMSNYKDLITSIKNYLPTNYNIQVLKDFSSALNTFNLELNNKHELETLSLLGRSKLYYNENFQTTYGGYNVMFNVSNGKIQAIFIALIIK